MSKDDKDFIESCLLGMAQSIHLHGLPKQPFILNSFSPDGHSIYVCIWPAETTEGWRTRALRVPDRGFEVDEVRKR